MRFNIKAKVGIIAAHRLPIGKFGGYYRDILPEVLYQQLIEQQFSQIDELKQTDVDQVILGNVTNQGGNLARRAALQAGFSSSVPALTLDCQCGSGLSAIVMAANQILSKDARVVCSGGLESPSTAHTILDHDSQQVIKRFKMAPDGFKDLDMGVVADLTAKKLDISRHAQDVYALNSHSKAVSAIVAGKLSDEVYPFDQNQLITQDQSVRFESSLAALAKLTPAFSASGTSTAGNSCPISDGVSSIILGGLDLPYAFEGYYLGQATVGVAPEDFLVGPIKSTEQLLAQFDLTIDDIDAVELNEAFAVQALLFQKQFQLSNEQLNGYGGALAYGHPFGATGSILIARLLNRLNQLEKSALGIATLCIAGGMGCSILIGNRWWGK